jgi:hypothetical protein
VFLHVPLGIWLTAANIAAVIPSSVVAASNLVGAIHGLMLMIESAIAITVHIQIPKHMFSIFLSIRFVLPTPSTGYRHASLNRYLGRLVLPLFYCYNDTDVSGFCELHYSVAHGLGLYRLADIALVQLSNLNVTFRPPFILFDCSPDLVRNLQAQ